MPDPSIVQFKGNRFAEILLKFPCPQKILMVTDGFLGFGTGGFGLSEFVGIVGGAGHAVSTAHRSGDPNATIPGAFSFATAIPAVTTANYDQLWLFGFSGGALADLEQAAIAQFMAAGGGVFATGDHEAIGAGMGANIPRVRGMRNWSTVPMVDPERHDTVVDPGTDSIKQFDDQADAIPQRIYPVFFSNGGPDNVASSWSVHPLLRHPSGAVDVLPDHAHESECLAPSAGAGDFAGVEEWPRPLGGGRRIRAKVVAISVSAGRFITDTTKPPVRPHCFGAISAYDGDAASVGRIVCDATWHHFVNINLNGSGADPDPATGNPREGLYIGGAATPEYLKIQRYFLNTARWLAPRGRRNCWPFLVASLARFDFEMLEFDLPRPHPCPWDPLLRIGTIAEEVMNRKWGPGAAADIVEDLLASSDSAPTLVRALQAQQSREEGEDGKAEPSLLPLHDMRRAILGSVVNLLAHRLPTDESKLTVMLKDGHDGFARELTTEGVRAAHVAIGQQLQRALKHTTAQVEAVLAGK